MKVTWLGQGGFLFEAGAARVAVDPYLSDALAPKGLPRLYPPPMTAEGLSPTLVVFTHDHDDHFDPVTVAAVLKAHPACLFAGSPETVAHAVETGAAETQCTVLGAGDVMEHAPLRITATPAEHSGGALGLVIADGQTRAYVSGDTLYRDDLAKAVRDAAGGPLDIVVVCINGRWGNMPAEDALRLVGALEPRAAAPMHYDLFANNSAEARPFLDGCRAMGVVGFEMAVGEAFAPEDMQAET